jgi:hypothetical protein
MRLNEDGKTVRAMDILSLGWKLWEDHKEKSVLMFWSKNESRIDEERIMVVFRYKTIWFSSSFRFWTLRLKIIYL